MPAPEGSACAICADPLDTGSGATCNGCGRPFHLVLTQSSEGKNCGGVWLNEEFMTLEFGCAACLAEQRAAAAPTAATAAEAVPLAQPVQRGRVKHTGISARALLRRKRRA